MEAETMAWVSDSNDPNNAEIESKIREQISKPEGELTKADLEKVEELFLDHNQLTMRLKGLERLTKLTKLVLEGNQLTDVEGLEKLTQLTVLVIAFTKVTDVKGLGKLTQLRVLELFSNQLTGVEGLGNLTQLTNLRLGENQLTELPKGLEKLTQLEELNPLYNPDLTKAQIAELQKVLPNCKIYSNPK